jgi:hypothetical protein
MQRQKRNATRASWAKAGLEDKLKGQKLSEFGLNKETCLS